MCLFVHLIMSVDFYSCVIPLGAVRRLLGDMMQLPAAVVEVEDSILNKLKCLLHEIVDCITEL